MAEPMPDALAIAGVAAHAVAKLDPSFVWCGRSFSVEWTPTDRASLHLSIPSKVAVSTDVGFPVVCT